MILKNTNQDCEGGFLDGAVIFEGAQVIGLGAVNGTYLDCAAAELV